MMHKPVCINCETEYQCKKNSITVLDLQKGKTRATWQADLWECPKCLTQLATGFGWSDLDSSGIHPKTRAIWIEKAREAGTLYFNHQDKEE